MKTTITQQILYELKRVYRGTFVEYYDGDPVDIPQDALPCLIVQKTDTQVTKQATGLNRLIFKIMIAVVVNKADDMGKNANESVTQQRLESWAEAQTDDGQFDPESIMGILRTNMTLGQFITNQEASIAYGLVPRLNTLTAEARITFTANQTVQVTNTPS